MIRLRTQLDCLGLLLEVPAEAMERQPAPGKWSARENLAHLARYHEVFRSRLEKMLLEDRPELPRYRAEDDAEWPRWQALPLLEILGRMQAARAELVEFVGALSPEQWKRVGVHSKFGAMSVELWIEFFLLHEAHHLYVVLGRAREGQERHQSVTAEGGCATKVKPGRERPG